MDWLMIILISVILIEVSFLLIRSSTSKKTVAKRKIYVDTSALMDGRILSIAQSGFMSDRLIIPRSVIRELQLVADGKDSEKRRLARLGMQNARDLERVEFCDVEILQDELDHTPVDERLIALAKANHGTIFTTDYNLCQVAATEHVDTLNPNTLMVALDMDVQAGSVIELKLTEPGARKGQAVGHLDGGVMVVVNSADKLIGQVAKIIVRRANVTDSGRIIFADIYRPDHKRQGANNPQKTKAQKTTK